MKSLVLPYRFHYHYKTNYSEAVYVTGSIPALGNWDIQHALRLIWCQNDEWILEIDFDLSQAFEYKYFISTYDSPTLSYIKWVEERDQQLNRHYEIPGHLFPKPIQEQSNIRDRNHHKIDSQLIMADEDSVNVLDFHNMKKCLTDDSGRDIRTSLKTDIFQGQDTKLTQADQDYKETFRDNEDQRSDESNFKGNDEMTFESKPTEYEILNSVQKEVFDTMLQYLCEYSNESLPQKLEMIFNKNPQIQKEELIELINHPLREKIWALPKIQETLKKSLSELQDDISRKILEIEIREQVFSDLKSFFGRDVLRVFEDIKQAKTAF